MTAFAIDEFVLEHLGFGLSDLIEIGLQYLDERLSRISPTWAYTALPRDLPDPDNESLSDRIERIFLSSVHLTEREVVAARDIPSLEASLERCSNPDRARSAWQWASLPADRFAVNVSPQGHPLGRALSIGGPSGSVPVPSGMVLCGLASGMASLSAMAAEDLECKRRVSALAVFRAMEILESAKPPAEERSAVRPGSQPETDATASDVENKTRVDAEIGMVLLPAKGHAFAVEVVGALDVAQLGHELRAADARLSKIDEDRVRGLGVPMSDTGSLFRFVIYGGPLDDWVPRRSKGDVLHVHVEELATFVLAAQQNELGPDLVYQFLCDAIELDGIDELICLDLMDLWHHWRYEGAISPTAPLDAVLINSIPNEIEWFTSALWDPIESVLFGRALPPITRWNIAKLDQPGQATLWTEDGRAFIVSADPPLIVTAKLDEALDQIGVDRSFAIGVADGLLLTIERSRWISDLLTSPDGTPLMIDVGFMAETHSSAHDQGVIIGQYVDRPPNPVISLLLGPDWLQLLVDDPENAHRILGDVLRYCAGRMHGRDESETAWLVASEEFTTAWQRTPPVAGVHLTERTLTFRSRGHVRLPLSVATAARARRALSIALLSDGHASGVFRGLEAEELCLSTIVPTLESILSTRVASWSEQGLLAVAEHLNDVQAERARFDAELWWALRARWAENWQKMVLEEGFAPPRARPLELLLETLLSASGQGDVIPDRYDIADAVDLAVLEISIGTTVAGYQHGLHSLGAWISPDGQSEVVGIDPVPGEVARPVGPGQLTFDRSAYLVTHRADIVRIRQEPTPDEMSDYADQRRYRLVDKGQSEETPFVRLADQPEGVRLLKADRLLKAAWGTGFDGLHAVYGTAVSWPGDDGVQLVSVSDLHAEAMTWSGLDSEVIAAAIERLALRPEALREEGIAYWEIEDRHHRLTVKPLPILGGQIILMPWVVQKALELYLAYLDDGQLPLHDDDFPGSVRDALVDYRKKNNEDLERQAKAAIEALGLPCKSNIEHTDPDGVALALTGELDLLIGDPAHNRIWVCEVKDAAVAISERMLRRQVDRYWKDSKKKRRQGHLQQLGDLYESVSAHPLVAAEILGMESSGQPWRVVPLMITRRVEAAAFVSGVPVPFTVLEDLSDVVTSLNDPGPGYPQSIAGIV